MRVLGGPAECASLLSGDFNLLNKAIRLLRQSLTRLCARRGRAVFHRFAHSAGPGMVTQTVEGMNRHMAWRPGQTTTRRTREQRREKSEGRGGKGHGKSWKGEVHGKARRCKLVQRIEGESGVRAKVRLTVTTLTTSNDINSGVRAKGGIG